MAELELFDSHLHLTDPRLHDDLPDVLASAREAGVAEMVTVGTDPADARRARRLASREEGLWCTVGLHPHEASSFTDDTASELRSLLDEPGVVAVGETGLDFHYENSPREEQARSFRAHMELAEGSGMPVVVHSREADEETAAVVDAFHGRVTGVLHCFTGGEELLEAAVGAGWYVSLSGIATFEGFDAAARLERIPDDRLLIETDSPYLAPVPVRGRRNEPAFVAHLCRYLAELRGEPPAVTARLTRRNARRFYALDPA